MADLLFIMAMLFSFCFHTVVLFSDLHFKLFGDMHTLFCTLSLWRSKVASEIWVQTENIKGKE